MRDERAAPGTTRPRTTPFASSASRNGANVVAANAGVSSWISIPKRRSGLSEPYLPIASLYGIRGSGSGTSTPISAKAALITGSIRPKTMSGVANEISTSTWVNSGWRSARRSSSRKQRAIWK